MKTPNYARAKKALHALVQGIDPDTGQELAADTVLNRPAILRALMAALTALEHVNAWALRRAQLPKSVGKTSVDSFSQLKLRKVVLGQRLETLSRLDCGT